MTKINRLIGGTSTGVELETEDTYDVPFSLKHLH